MKWVTLSRVIGLVFELSIPWKECQKMDLKMEFTLKAIGTENFGSKHGLGIHFFELGIFLLHGLSAQELKVLELLVEGKIKKEVANMLNLSYHTVDNYVRRIYKKLHVHSLSAPVTKAINEKMF